MKTPDIPSLLHALKPDGHGNFSFATRLHEEANALQELADKLHAALKFTSSPEFKGEFLGEKHQWPKYPHLDLDHTGTTLHEIFVRDVPMWEFLSPEIQEEARLYVEERFREQSPATARTIARMDAADLRAEWAA